MTPFDNIIICLISESCRDVAPYEWKIQNYETVDVHNVIGYECNYLVSFALNVCSTIFNAPIGESTYYCIYYIIFIVAFNNRNNKVLFI